MSKEPPGKSPVVFFFQCWQGQQGGMRGHAPARNLGGRQGKKGWGARGSPRIKSEDERREYVLTYFKICINIF